MAKFFINRPIVAMVISILMVLMGLVSMSRLPVAQFPNIADPQIQVNATYPGADALTVQQSVAVPIEQQMSGVDNMEYMYSLSANNGSMKLTVDFDVKTDPNTDQILAQMRQGQANSQLPGAVVNQGVTVQKSTTSPLILFALYSPNKTYDSIFLANYSYININDAMTRVRGIASVTVFGAGQYAIRLWVRPDRLAQMGITVPEIINAIQQQNNVNPAGKIGGEPVPKGQEFTYAVRAQGRLETAEQFGDIVLRAAPGGAIVRVKDVARIELGSQNYDMMARLNGGPCALIALYQLPGSNAIDAANGAKQLMARLKESFPPDLDYVVALDTTLAVTEGMKEIEHTLIEAIVLVLIVVFVFLQGWRATLIPLLAVPVSLVGTFALFPMFGFSINTLSLFGLVLAIGLVVDDAIVVVEIVEHHIEKGLSPKEAALKGMEEVTGPVIAIAIILSAVFVPTAFIPGITGRLYQQFAVTIAVSVIISAFNALTLSPALSALLLRPKKKGTGLLQKFFDWFNKWFGRATDGYVGVCRFLVHKSALAMLLVAGVMVLTGVLGKSVATSFLPDEDQGYAFAGIQLPNTASLQRTDEVCHQVEEILKNTPGVKYYSTVVGYSLLSGVQQHLQRFLLHQLEEWSKRKKPDEKYQAIMAHLNARTGQDPRRDRFRLSAAGDSRRGHLGRRHVHAGGPLRQGHPVSGGEPAEVHGSRAKSARNWRACSPPPCPPCRRCSWTWIATRCSAGREAAGRLPDDAVLHGRRVRELLQPLRPAVAGVRAGRGRLPHEGRKPRPVLRAQQQQQHGAAGGVDERAGDDRTGIHHALQSLPGRANQRLGQARLQFGPGDEGDGGGLRRKPCRRDGLRLPGHELPGKQGAAGRLADGHLRFLAACACS